MFKKTLLAAAFVLTSCPAFVSAQDFFFSFDENSRVPTTTVTDSAIGSTGSLFIFADAGLGFNQLDLDFRNDNAAVVSFTGGVVFNPGSAGDGISPNTTTGAFTSFDLLDPTGVAPGVTPTDGRLFATSFLTSGQTPFSGRSNFRAGADGFLLAQVDFDIVGEGTANFEFIAGVLGIFDDGVGRVDASFGTGSLTVESVLVCAGFGPFPYCGTYEDYYPELEPEPEPEPEIEPEIEIDPSPKVPEPSSTILLILGAAAMVAGRRRS